MRILISSKYGFRFYQRVRVEGISEITLSYKIYQSC